MMSSLINLFNSIHTNIFFIPITAFFSSFLGTLLTGLLLRWYYIDIQYKYNQKKIFFELLSKFIQCHETFIYYNKLYQNIKTSNIASSIEKNDLKKSLLESQRDYYCSISILLAKETKNKALLFELYLTLKRRLDQKIIIDTSIVEDKYIPYIKEHAIVYNEEEMNE